MPAKKQKTVSKTKDLKSSKSSPNNKKIIFAAVAVFALVGGFFIYRSFAARPAITWTGADRELKVNAINGGSLNTRRYVDAGYTILEASKGSGSDFEFSVKYNRKIKKGTVGCFYVQVVDKNNNTVTSNMIPDRYKESLGVNISGIGKGIETFTETDIGYGYIDKYGTFLKYCTKTPIEQNGATLSLINYEANGGSPILDGGYKVRVLKATLFDKIPANGGKTL